LDKDQKDEPAVEISDQAFDLNGIILWLVDDDLRFRQVMREWLTNKGAKCCPLSGDRELQAAIASVNAGDCASPTHILLDGELAHSGEWEACRKLLEEYLPEVPTCLCSSHSNYLRDIDLPGFQKPVDLTSLCDWLQNGILPNKNVLELQGQSIETNPLWVDEALSRDFICDAGKFLSNICDGSIPAVLWAERVRPGVYEIVAFHGLDQDRLVQTRYAFGQSLLANVIESRVHESLPVSAIGPLKEILPLGCSRVYGLSLEP
jgi:CheY-like chemotaxis protein